jgi:hypothetical protein
MKIDVPEQHKEETNHRLNPVTSVDVNDIEIHQIQSNELYHVSLLPLSSSSVKSYSSINFVKQIKIFLLSLYLLVIQSIATFEQ